MGDKLLRTLRTYCLALSLITIPVFKSYATHVFGIDLYYTHVSGNTYKIYLIVYGDCAGAAFPYLQNATPEIKVYDDPNPSPTTTIDLAEEPPIAGVEVTPVCPQDINNTTCTNINNTIPGIKKFVYSLNYTVPYASANWRFRFTGAMGTTQAGRSSTITNITNPGNTIIALDAKLNNLTAANNSSVFGTIPTPFYCLNAPAHYAPGSTDADNDSLYFVQIPGIDDNGFPPNPPYVTYIAPYTATAPLAANPFVFVPTTGQMDFTPNLVQRSLAVMEVQEYRNQVLVGTSQREMTVVVLNTCSNTAPSGVISNPSAGTLLDSTTLQICQNIGPFTFDINPTDVNGDTIDVTPIGIPAGATFTILNNHTLAPTCTFAWNTTNVTPGTYTFYLNYSDNECPLSANQQIAYQVIVAPAPHPNVTLVSPATCAKKAVFTVDPGAGFTNWTETVMQNVTMVHTNANLNGTLTDSLVSGTYTISATSEIGCTNDTVVTFADPVMPVLSAILTPPTCPGGSDGSITINGTGGAPPYSYALNAAPYGPTNVFTGLAAGTYTLHLTDTNTCVKDSVVTLPDGAPILLNASVKSPLCGNIPDGIVTISAYNNPATPYTYALDNGPYGPSSTFSGLAAGTYTFHVQNATGCQKDTTITLSDSITVTASIVISDVSCYGDSSGVIGAVGAGGIVPYTYALDANPYTLNNTFFNLPAGSYDVHVRDSNSCAFDTTVNVQQPTPIILSASIANPPCNGDTTGGIGITASGGTPGYTYANGAGPYTAVNTFNNLGAGTYTIHVQDANGCIKDTVITLTEPTPIVASPAITTPLCYGDATGTITITASGGTPGYTYANGAGPYTANNNFTNLPAGTYTIHTQDANGCIKDTIVDITQPDPVTVDALLTNPLCYGDSTGTITVNGGGGTPGYTYANDPAPYAATNTFTNLPAGTYTIHTKDSHDCVKDTALTIIQPDPLVINPVVSNVLCNGGTGSIAVTVTGGTPGYTYANGAGPYDLVNIFTPLAAGTYTIHAQDTNSCQTDTVIDLTEPTPLEASATVNDIMCNGDSSGSITMTASGGTPGYTYANGAGPYTANNIFNNLGAGTYTIHTQDANGCTKDTVITLTEPTPLTVDPAKTDPLCYGDANGSITITAAGGTPGYTYANGVGPYTANNNFTNLAAGTYTIHTQDDNGCIKDTVIDLIQPDPVTVDASLTNPLCYGDSTGTITVNGGGGTPGYTYANDPTPYAATNTFTNLAAGTYTIHTKDSHDCIKDTTLTITQPAPLVLNPTVSNVLCNGGTGSITVIATGGTPGYVYANGAGPYDTVSIFTPLAAGTYTLHARDTNSCQTDTVLDLTQPTPLEASATVDNVLCNGGTGTITMTGSGGTPSYTYANGAGPYTANNVFTPLAAGTYTIHTKDANGCIKDTVITITQPPLLTVSGSPTDVLCNGDATGSITVNGAGGTPTYTYANGAGPYAATNTFTNLTAGTYTIHTKDDNGCIKDTVFTITQPSAIVVTPVVTNVLCNGGTGGITVTATGGVPAYTYANGVGPYTANNAFTPLAAGTYTIHTQDANGCIKDVTSTITQPTPLVATPTVSNVLCSGGNSGSITIAASGGTPGYTYANGAGPYGPSNVFAGLPAGTYTIHTQDANGCIKDTSITITQPTPVTVSGNVTDVLCHGDATGSITINGAGGTPGYTYANGAGPYAATNTFTGLTAGTYTIHTKDANSCTKDTVFTITEPTPIAVTPLVKNSTCATLGNGIVTLAASGGTPGYTYANGAGPYTANNVFTPLPAGNYIFHVKDAHNCIKDINVTIADSLHPAGTVNVTDELCYGQSIGAITVTGSGATAPYTYALGNNPYGNSNTFSQLAAGTYNIHIKDANGCIKDTTATIAQPTPIASNSTFTEPSCFGYNDGSLTINGSGGTPAYTYGLNNGPMGANNSFNGMAAGTDTVHIQDNNGCTYDTLVAITQPTKLLIDSLVLLNEKCFGDNNGMITVYAHGGTPAYTYAIDANAFQSASTFGSLAIGTYVLHVKDSHDCATDSTAGIIQPPPLWLDGANITEPTCEGYADGTVALNATGGTAPYTYSIDGSNFSNTTTFPGLPEGTYTFYVTDSNNCHHDTTMTLIGFPHILIEDAVITPPKCYGGSDGSIEVNAAGGTPPYLYQVDGDPNPATSTRLFTDMAAGNHTITVTDSNNCHKSGSVEITQPDSISIAFTVALNQCYGTADQGVIEATVTGGTGPYIYAWSNDTTGPDLTSISHLANGAYRLTIYDSNNCMQKADTEMTSGECCIPYIPNAFTPNGDGKNDIFRPIFKGNMKLIMFQVFNRFGEMVYETDKPGQGWDGTYKGVLSDMDTYFFHMRFICGDGGKEQYLKGDVTLIR